MSPSDLSNDGFVQDYRLGRRQELYIYCRLCRSTFPVAFRPPTRSVRLRCLCGHEAPLNELDVFRSEAAAREHAAFYERIYSAAKDALREAGVPLPPSGKYRRVEDVEDDSGFESYYDPVTDASAVEAAYLEREESDETRAGLDASLARFEARLEPLRDPLERHEVLSELIEWSYCRQDASRAIQRRFVDACREDMGLAGDVVRRARELIRQGEKVRVSFTSFKHLATSLEREDELEQALAVAEEAAALGLKGYAERARELRDRLREA